MSLYYTKPEPYWKEFLEISLFPFIKEHIKLVNEMTCQTSFLTLLTRLPDLYKVFERC